MKTKDIKVTQKQAFQCIANELEANDKFVKWALNFLFERQTVTEQAHAETEEHNNVGFTSCDAPFLTSVHQWWNDKGFVTQKQLTSLKKCLFKYKRQLYREMPYEYLEEIIWRNRDAFIPKDLPSLPKAVPVQRPTC